MTITAEKRKFPVLSFLIKALDAYFGVNVENQEQHPYSNNLTDGVDETETGKKKSIMDEDYFWFGCGCGWC